MYIAWRATHGGRRRAEGLLPVSRGGPPCRIGPTVAKMRFSPEAPVNRTLLGSLAALTLAGCTNDYQIGALPEPIPVSPNPPDLEILPVEDVMVQRIPEQVDVLWVVDSSSSMEAEQRKLAENFPVFLQYYRNSGLDWQIGVISMDMVDGEQKGRLQGGAGYLWVDEAVPDPTGVFKQIAVLGTGGHFQEKGRAAAYAALSKPLVTGYNGGFFRDDAKLSVIFVSDENDRSGDDPSLGDFKSFLTDLKPDPSMITVSAIVGLSDDSCARAEGRDYRNLVGATGGAEFDICRGDWTPILEELGVRGLGLEREFFLSRFPVVDTLEVWIEDEGERFDFEPGVEWVYDGARNSLVFLDYTPRASAEIHAVYEEAGVR